MHEIRIRHGFEFYHRKKYGYYPSWDGCANEYLVKCTQEKWMHWKAFFQKPINVDLESIALRELPNLYLNSMEQNVG